MLTVFQKGVYVTEKCGSVHSNSGMVEHTLPLSEQCYILTEYMHDFWVGQFMYRQVNCLAPVAILNHVTFNYNVHHV